MTNAQIVITVIVLGIGVLAALGMLFRMAQEKNRLWGRYQHLKAIMERQDYFREAAERREDVQADGGGTVIAVGPSGPVKTDNTPTDQPAQSTSQNTPGATEGAGTSV